MGKEVPMDLFRAMYVNSYYPMLDGYAYKADCHSIEVGRHQMWLILSDVEWIEDGGDAGPILHMNDGRTLYVYDSEDFPQPTDQCWDEEDREIQALLEEPITLSEEEWRAWEDGLGQVSDTSGPAEHRALSGIMIHPYVRWRK